VYITAMNSPQTRKATPTAIRTGSMCFSKLMTTFSQKSILRKAIFKMISDFWKKRGTKVYTKIRKKCENVDF
jgi:hypothetical protein